MPLEGQNEDGCANWSPEPIFDERYRSRFLTWRIPQAIPEPRPYWRFKWPLPSSPSTWNRKVGWAFGLLMSVDRYIRMRLFSLTFLLWISLLHFTASPPLFFLRRTFSRLGRRSSGVWVHRGRKSATGSHVAQRWRQRRNWRQRQKPRLGPRNTKRPIRGGGG